MFEKIIHEQVNAIVCGSPWSPNLLFARGMRLHLLLQKEIGQSEHVMVVSLQLHLESIAQEEIVRKVFRGLDGTEGLIITEEVMFSVVSNCKLGLERVNYSICHTNK